MDWKSSRIDTLLEQALVEDKAASDATTNVTIDPGLRAAASVVARQEMIVAGLGAVRGCLRFLPGLITARRPTIALKSSVILKSSMAYACTEARYLRSFATTPACSSVANASS